MSALVEIQDISKIYNPGENEVWALDHISLTIQKGEFVAIIGQSGSGKSTLMNMIGCQDVPTEGTYILNGQNVSKLSDNELSDIRNQEIGFIFQGFNLIANLTAQENVELPLTYLKVKASERKQMVNDILKRMNISHRAAHFPQQVSGGQQQRVAIARALIAKPQVILADEPTGALDSKPTVEVKELLRRVNLEGLTMVIVTHEPSVSEATDRIFRVIDGLIETIEKGLGHV